jgi:iron-sulfur cluster insertion protein
MPIAAQRCDESGRLGAGNLHMNDSANRVEVSGAAARRIAEILAAEAPGAAFRISVDGGGCSGFKYVFSVDAAPTSADFTIEAEGARIVVDEASLSFLAGACVDFVDDLRGQAFRVENPNAASSCGCGTSFSVG